MRDEKQNGAKREARPTPEDQSVLADIQRYTATVERLNQPSEPLESMADYWARRDRELAAEQAFIAGTMAYLEFLSILTEVL